MSFIGANILQESARRKHTRRIPKIVQNPNPGGRIPFRGDPSWLGVSKHKNRSISFNKMLFWTDEISDIENSENASPILSTLFHGLCKISILTFTQPLCALTFCQIPHSADPVPKSEDKGVAAAPELTTTTTTTTTAAIDPAQPKAIRFI